ncbi:MAG: hypothetical protein KC501_37050, partial [Myxococcales bacterium]|nr:hypothetical protein [Myxococcales bacterium]
MAQQRARQRGVGRGPAIVEEHPLLAAEVLADVLGHPGEVLGGGDAGERGVAGAGGSEWGLEPGSPAASGGRRRGLDLFRNRSRSGRTLPAATMHKNATLLGLILLLAPACDRLPGRQAEAEAPPAAAAHTQAPAPSQVAA